MEALGSYGVTNERLDMVSDYYRYVRGRGALWPTKPAAGYALVETGKITRFVVTRGGSGYSSPPTTTVPNFDGIAVKVELSFSKQLKKNGSGGCDHPVVNRQKLTQVAPVTGEPTD